MASQKTSLCVLLPDQRVTEVPKHRNVCHVSLVQKAGQRSTHRRGHVVEERVRVNIRAVVPQLVEVAQDLVAKDQLIWRLQQDNERLTEDLGGKRATKDQVNPSP